MEYQTLILNSWWQPHKIIPWQRSVFQLTQGKIKVIEAYPGEVVRSAYREFPLPSVAHLVKPVSQQKNGVKFSRLNVYTRDGFRCQYCGRRMPMKHLNYDHVVPRIKGGRTVWENIVTSCYTCNDRKGSRTLEQSGMRLLSQPHKPKSLPLVAPVWKTNRMPEAWAPYLNGVEVVVEEQESA